ncbi:MAG TPA: beta-N-acetylhexosaminidase [Mariniphaga sp.]|nr:beta-N-acetylhexosaminidase [Mariniphaga sp.]
MKNKKMILKQFVLVILILLPGLSFAQGIIPFPNDYKPEEGTTKFPRKISVYTQDDEFARLIPVVGKLAGDYFSLEIREANNNGFVELIRNNSIQNEEGYQIKINSQKIRIEAGSPAGCFYGLQSVIQLIDGHREEKKLANAVIEDSPLYELRGVMLDESRHFFGKEYVMQLLDYMAIHKLNIFHWHLTDVPGWRIEIKKYPLLTTVGGVGNNSNPDAPATYYTQEEIKEIVEYAQQRFIEIIPEIDMPGHATAAVKAYPEYSGGGSERYPDFTFNPGFEGTYQFLTDILSEVTELFPSDYIHIGGDEVHFGNEQWNKLPEIKDLMNEHQLNTLVDVEHYFLKRMADSVKHLGKTVMGWDEVMAAGLSNENTVVMWWRHDKPQLLKEALEKNYPVIMCPRIPLYLDFVQHESHQHGRKWQGNFAPIEGVYEFPSERFTGGVDFDSPLIKGIQGNVWSEVIHTPERLQFMLYPRLSALSEAAWTKEENKSAASFFGRLTKLTKIYDKHHVRYYDYMNPQIDKEVPGPQK